MSMFKKFFDKKKLEGKFKKAGEGHKLSATATAASKSSTGLPSSSSPSKASGAAAATAAAAAAGRSLPPDGARMAAGMAALQRIENRSAPSMANRSQNVIRAEALKELEAERRQQKLESKTQGESPPPQSLVSNKDDDHDSGGGGGSSIDNSVFFTCPLVGAYVLPKREMQSKIREFLYEQLDEEPGLISCLIIRTCNKDREKVLACVETLVKCLNNVIEHPDEEKYRRLRVNNKAFQEKVVSVEGSLSFLLAAGFESQMLGDTDDQMEEFYVLPMSSTTAAAEELTDRLETLRDALISSEPICPELDRNVKVLAPAQQLERVDLPPEFYRLSLDELRREQQQKAELVEKSTMLRTKAMREREAARERRLYRFCFVRTRLPDGLVLQGTFKTWEKLSDVRQFIGEQLVDRTMTFRLATVTGHQLNDDQDDATLADLGLIPAVVIQLVFDNQPPQPSSGCHGGYLKPEILALCTQLGL